MKHIIGLFGASNRGKSSTLKMLIQELVQSQNFENIDLDDFKSMKDKGDFCTTLKYKPTGCIVCIATGGDDFNTITKNIEYAEKNNADILITATRTGGSTIMELYPKIKNDVPFFISKTYHSSVEHLGLTEDKINKLDLQNILLVLNGFLNPWQIL